jgi:hypothetical protein
MTIEHALLLPPGFFGGGGAPVTPGGYLLWADSGRITLEDGLGFITLE